MSTLSLNSNIRKLRNNNQNIIKGYTESVEYKIWTIGMKYVALDIA